MNAFAIQHVNLLLSQFGAEHGLEHASLNAEGTCTLGSPEGVPLVMEISEDGATLHWYSPLIHPPAEGREAFFADLLERNLLCVDTHGATLALDASSNEVVLCYSQPVAALDPTRFGNISENLLSTAARLSQELRETVATRH